MTCLPWSLCPESKRRAEKDCAYKIAPFNRMNQRACSFVVHIHLRSGIFGVLGILVEGGVVDGLDFAIDGLYAAGWWPDDSDQCIQAHDGRWYPSESTVQTYFAHAFVRLIIKDSVSLASVQASWKSFCRAPQSVRGRSRQEAVLLAFGMFYAEFDAQSGAHSSTRSSIRMIDR